MPRKQRPGKFVIKYNRRDGYQNDTAGTLETVRAERLLALFTAVICYGEAVAPGFTEVLDQYMKDYDARVSETEAAKQVTT